MALAPKWILIIVISLVAIATIWYLVQRPASGQHSVASTVSSTSNPLGNSFKVSKAVESAVEPNTFRNVQTNPFASNGSSR